MYILIELSELVVFDYGPYDTQDDLRCLRNGIYILRFNILSLWQELMWAMQGPCALLF